MSGFSAGELGRFVEDRPGFESRVFVDRDWRVLSETERASKYGRRCRYIVGATRCPNQAVAELDRRHAVGRRPIWWAYCGRHLYGRAIEDGRVVELRLRPISAPLDEPGFVRRFVDQAQQ